MHAKEAIPVESYQEGGLSKPVEILVDRWGVPPIYAAAQADAFFMFEAFFQPKVDIATGRVTGAEALARWRHPEHGLVPPIAFIPQLEGQGPIEQLTGVMLRQAVRACLACRSAGIPLTVAVNVSVRSLADLGMADQIMDIVKDEGGLPQDIILEVTET